MLERLVGGVVLLGLLVILALVIGPRDGGRMPDEEDFRNPAAPVALQPAQPGIAGGSEEGRRPSGPRAAAQRVPPGSVARAPQPARSFGAPSSSPGAVVEPAGPSAAQWGVQLGSFAKRGNAAALSDWCREQGYNVKIAAATEQGDTLYRVRVGPFATRGDAQSAKAELALQGRPSFITGWEAQAP